MKNTKVLHILVFLSALAALPTDAATEVDNRIWFNLNAQGQLPFENFGWYAELQPRTREEGEELDQLLVRAAVNYKLSQQSSLWLGYGNIRTHRIDAGIVDENRLWQQYTHNFNVFDDVVILSRTRLEQRKVETGHDIGHRVRQMLRFTKPFGTGSRLSLTGSNEVYFNVNDTDWGARSGFDQNRLFVGIAYALSPKARVEARYLNQFIDTATVDRMNRVLSLTMSLNF